MHRIDGPGATVDNKFTDGDPVGGLPATMVTDEWLNDVQEELMSVLSAAGIAPLKGAQDQLLKAIRGVSGGVIGASRNVKMSIGAASGSATLTADQIYVGTSLSGQSYRLANFNKTINLATVGAGGMDVGTAPINSFVSLYAIYNPSTNTSALLACAQSTSSGSIYSGANLPVGYTASALISSWATSASGIFKTGYQRDRTVYFQVVRVATTTVATGSLVGVSLTSAVPLSAISFGGNIGVVNGSTAAMGIIVAGDTLGTGAQNVNCTSAQVTAPFICPIIVPQAACWSTTSGGGTPTFSMDVSSYTF